LFSNGQNGMGIFLLFALVGVGLVDNFLRPYLVKGAAELSFFWLFMAFVGGLAVFGPLGVIAGPLIFSLFAEFLKLYELQSMNKN
jgi:predicted PurR-regulated permease PerM